MKLKHLLYRACQNWHAARSIRRLRTLEAQLATPQMRLAVPFVFRGAGFFKRISPMQSHWEISALYALVLGRQPQTVVEIGTCNGGTLYLWCQAAHPQASLISIDLPGGEFGGGYRECRTRLYQAFAQPGQRLHLLRADSHAAATRQQVAAALGPRKAELLFIDGDHTYAGVRRDFELYSPLVAPGGLIALHDIARRPAQPEIEVWRFWAELKGRFESQEWIDPTPGGRAIGIGLVKCPA